MDSPGCRAGSGVQTPAAITHTAHPQMAHQWAGLQRHAITPAACTSGTPFPLPRTTVKALSLMETMPRTRTQAAKQCIIDAKTAMSMEVHQNHALREGGDSGRTAISVPGIPSPGPNPLIFTDNQKKDPQIPSKRCGNNPSYCSDRGVVRAGEGGEGEVLLPCLRTERRLCGICC